jgi:hypothetical protein
LKDTDSSKEVQEAAKLAGHTCKKAVGWGYDYSPSICTSKKCCGNGGCTGWCTYGSSRGRSCSKLNAADHRRLCPCSSKAPVTPGTTPAPKPPSGSGAWVLAVAGTSCDTACKSAGSKCDAAKLKATDSSQEVMAAAKSAGHTCKKTVGWGYSYSPSICTGSKCCSGSCVGWCTYGTGKGRSCSDWGCPDHQRLCPCTGGGAKPTTQAPTTTQPPSWTTQAPSPPPANGDLHKKIGQLEKTIDEILKLVQKLIGR